MMMIDTKSEYRKAITAYANAITIRVAAHKAADAAFAPYAAAYKDALRTALAAQEKETPQ